MNHSDRCKEQINQQQNPLAGHEAVNDARKECNDNGNSKNAAPNLIVAFHCAVDSGEVCHVKSPLPEPSADDHAVLVLPLQAHLQATQPR